MTAKTLDNYNLKSVGLYMNDFLDHIKEKSDGNIICVTIIASREDGAVTVVCPDDEEIVDSLITATINQRMKTNKEFQEYKKTMKDKMSELGL